MNVYQISTFAKPPESKFRYYAQLAAAEKNEKAVSTDYFQGKPYPKKWKRIELHFHEPSWPRANFYNLGLSNFVCDNRVRKEIGDVLGAFGEFLPVTIKGEQGEFYVYHVTTCESFIDPLESIWECDKSSPEELKTPIKGILASPAFDVDKLSGVAIFMLPKKTYIYCVERPGKASAKEFKALVESSKLVGLRFDLVWSEKKGVIPLRNVPSKESRFAWLTGDGKKYRNNAFEL